MMSAGLPSNVDRDESYGAAALCYVTCVDRYNPKYGLSFETYATLRIRGAIRDTRRRLDWVPRRTRVTGGQFKTLQTMAEFPRNAAGVRSFEEDLADEWDAEDRAVAAKTELAAVMDQLTEQERFVIKSTLTEGRTLAAVGRDLGVSESRACQIRKRALRRLRRDRAAA